MAASREEVTRGIRQGLDWVIPALESVRAPILIVDCHDACFDIIFANACARRCLSAPERPLVGSALADFIDGTAFPAFLEGVNRTSESDPGHSRHVNWLGVGLDANGETHFTRLPSLGARHLVLVTLPARSSSEAPSSAAEPARIADWLRLSLRAAHMYAWRWDRNSDEFEVLLSENTGRGGLELGFRDMEGMFACVHPEDLERVSRSVRLTLEEEIDFKEEFRLRIGEDDYRWYAVVGRPIIDQSGSVTGIAGATQDVTSRRLSLARAGEYSELLRSAAANTRDVLLLLDRNLNIRFCNRNIRGIAPQQLVGQPVQNVLDGPNWAIHAQLLASVMTTGEPASFAHEAMEDGESLHKYDSRANPTFEGEQINGLSLTISDITERLRMEREVLEISSREQERIGQDLHDGLGQELTGVSLMLRSLATKLSHDNSTLAGEVEEIIRSVNLSIESARSLARGLSPFNSSRGGLVRALRSLAARSRELFGLNVRFRSKVWPQLTLDENQSGHLFRITQEALTNIARHARASLAEIRFQVADGRFTLTIADNGIGMDSSPGSGDGLGLKLMAYRAGMIGARLEVLPNEPKGTVIRVCGEQPTTG